MGVIGYVVGLMMASSSPLGILTVPVAQASELTWTQESVKEYAILVAEDYGLHVGRFLATLKCENGFNPKGQSTHPNRQIWPAWYVPVGDPLREQSFGPAQINLPSHPGITQEMAEDPLFAIPWMADKFSKGHAWLWTCWRGLPG